MPPRDLITVAEAAAIKRVSTQRVYQWIGNRRLTQYILYGRVLVSEKEVRAIKNRKPGPKPKA